ncbi:hypothetical protein [Lactobacillus sp. ESL0230]|uniref:hypothetical protein n=1 Tax=Lactobacillus sp. ESL0230 TaxID=2069353 RepID=UPI000EFA5F4D|nr:hypothetical protein [Lactobacillus sp. ESL0230]RMC46544.1 hypothetical protein F5ESL0230_04620 [Lactobacillus sp. ESL0230]
MNLTDKEFDKRDNKMSADITQIRNLIDSAENLETEIVDGVSYSAAHIWKSVAKLALDLSDQQEWFDEYFDAIAKGE